MKKVIGILGVAVIAATMFFSANSANTYSTNTDLASLIAMNTANAEQVLVEGCKFTDDDYDRCYKDTYVVGACIPHIGQADCGIDN